MKGVAENLIIARERPSPTNAGIWETHTQVMNFTMTPKTDDGEARLEIILDHHRQALGWARRNGWKGQPRGPLARLAAGEAVAPVVPSQPSGTPPPPKPHNPEDQGLFMHANCRDKIDIETIPKTSPVRPSPSPSSLPTPPVSPPSPPPPYVYTKPTDAAVEAARAVLPVEQHRLPPAYIVMLARGQEREAAIARLPDSGRRR